MDIKNLEDIIIENSRLYYTNGESNLTDQEFDYYINMLRAYDPQNPILNETGWGYKEASQNKVKHPNGKIIGIPDKISPNKVSKLPKSNIYYLTPKLDGLSVISYYENGRYVGSLTRGDGDYGQNITHHVRQMVTPTLVDLNGNQITGMIRGEFIISKKTWNLKYASEFKSARNFGAGLLNRLEVSPQVKDFEILHYSLFDCYKEVSYEEQFKIFDKNNIKRVSFFKQQDINFRSLVSESQCKITLNSLINNQYECDGLVCVSVDSLGESKRFAIKWNGDGIRTKVIDIVWEQSRLGYYKPVVIIEPVNISGATIKRASAFNYQYVIDNNLGIGSDITIVRSGEVIPYIVDVLSESSDNKAPKVCPYCNQELKQHGVELKCTNDECPGTNVINTRYFINTVLDVDGLGDSLINIFLDHFKIGSVRQLIKYMQDYKTDGNSQLGLMRFCQFKKGLGSSSYQKLNQMLEQLYKPKELTLIIAGLGLNGLGIKTVEKIFKNVKCNDDFINIIYTPYNNTMNIPNLSHVAVESIAFNSDYIKEVVSAFTNVVYPSTIDEDDENMLKYDIGICVTGALSVSRRIFFEKCKKRGIEEVPITRAKILVTNNKDSGSTKNKEAVKRGIPVMSEEEFTKEYLK